MTKQNKNKEINIISDEWANYILCLIFHTILPLLPLFFEMLIKKSYLPSIQTLSITISLYFINIGLSSRSKALFGFCFVLGFFYSVVFGLTSGTNDYNDSNLLFYSVLFCFFSVFFMHAIERYNRHVVLCDPFLCF